MRFFILCVGATLAIGSGTAEAMFFSFVPRSDPSKFGDVLTSAEGTGCARDNAKVGDILTSPIGNTATIKSLSGISSQCANPAFPIQVVMLFDYKFSSTAGIEAPDGYVAQQLGKVWRDRGRGLKFLARPKVILP